MPAAIMSPAAPPAIVGPKTKGPTRPENSLPQYLIDESHNTETLAFNAGKHVQFVHPEKIYTMKEIGLEGQGISPNAASAPFQMFTQEAIQQMRREIFSDRVLESCQYSSDFAKNMVRGFGAKFAPFIFDAWHSPEVLNAISKVAGIELIPAIDYDVGHVNISVNNYSTEIVAQGENPLEKPKDDASAFAWHFDSFPFVCVTMLSDCTGMIGGETMMRTGNGGCMKVRGPSMGTAVIMQGRYIEHQALKALGGRERIAMVTSFRPKNPLVRDEIVLTGVRPISNNSELYRQYTQYRLEVLEARIRDRSKKLTNEERASRAFNTAEVRSWIEEQKKYLDAMLLELIE